MRAMRILFGALCLLLSSPLAAQTSPAGSAAIVAIVAIEHAAEAAIVRRDSVGLDSLWAADLLFRHADGEVEQRSGWFDKIRSGVPLFQVRQPDSLTVVLHGNAAVVTGRLHVRSTRPVDEYWIRYMHVYAQRSGRWQLVHHHSLSLSETPPR